MPVDLRPISLVPRPYEGEERAWYTLLAVSMVAKSSGVIDEA